MSSNYLVCEDISRLLTLRKAAQKAGRRIQDEDLDIIEDAALIIQKGIIVWIGKRKDLRLSGISLQRAKRIRFNGQEMMPGFIECHTHTVFAGSRGAEFEDRLRGKSYQQIAKDGGGILSTVRATRKVSLDELKRISQARVDEFLRQGVTTLEIKSGYGLNFIHEKKILSVARALKGPDIVSTYLGLHARSPEISNFEDYTRVAVEKDLRKLAALHLCDRVDIFVDEGFFSVEHARALFQQARALGLGLTIHAEQLSRTGAARLAVEFGAQSADHLVKLNEDDISELARSEVTCVLLPASDFYLDIEYPAARALIDRGARVALSTDFNPGSSPTQDLAFVGLLARMKMKMTLPEVISSFTVGAAHALGRSDSRGSLEAGKRADFIVLNESWRDIFARVGQMAVGQVWVAGKNLKNT